MVEKESPHSKLTTYEKTGRRIYPKIVTPECFHRGSTLLTTTLSSLSKGRGVQAAFASHADGSQIRLPTATQWQAGLDSR